ncbi:hypothetical protein F5880DRAFT_1488795 [Lentinula raphanica]|nr:hypothetical protein F5880DRAFT_1488795 [Lentinula raphanica]
MSWDTLLNPLPSTVSGADDPLLAPLAISVIRNVRINRQTDVEELYHYTKNTKVEYPKTAPHGKAIGHLFDMDGSAPWISPARSFAYSQGSPDGSRNPVYTDLLVDSNGIMIPCSIRYSTCQGVKICPNVSEEIRSQTHTSGSRFARALDLERERQEANTSLDRDLFEKTLNYWACLRDYGCSRALQQDTKYEGYELEQYNTIHRSPTKKKRGHEAKPTCQGRIVLKYTSTGRAYLSCEHFDLNRSRKHFCDFAIGNDIYHTDYLLALCSGDSNEIYRWEKHALDQGYGPLAACKTVRNYNTMRIDCPNQHRLSNGSMLMTEMCTLPCKSTFHVYEPLPEYRTRCLKVLVLCSGQHSHPIPASTKTPPDVRSDILHMLCTSMLSELPDMTPRRFLRHPVARAFIRQKVPFLDQPLLSDVHPSLNNGDHLRSYITQAQQSMFPAGTGWEGLLRLKEIQDIGRSIEDQYIRVMEEHSLPDLSSHSMEEDIVDDNNQRFRIIICMFRQRSRDLLNARFVQTDISYKRVVGFKELEFVGWDDHSHTTIVYCRAYMTHESAAAHLVFFRLLDQLVQKDTGESLRFRHLHSQSLEIKDRVGILHWAMDQGRGPAKGLALYLHELAAKLSGYDLHEKHRYLRDLQPYEHLHRIARLCTAHVHRNISNSKSISEDIKHKMRSLMCTAHPNWDETISQIQDSGKGGRVHRLDWVADKISSKFAFEAMCQAKSFIPLDVWKAGPATTDLVESAHWSVYLEGIGCSLTSAVEKGEHVDRLRLQSSQVVM